MEQIKIPAGYHSDLNLHDTQVAIKTVKDFFQQTLSQKLNLLRVSARHHAFHFRHQLGRDAHGNGSHCGEPPLHSAQRGDAVLFVLPDGELYHCGFAAVLFGFCRRAYFGQRRRGAVSAHFGAWAAVYVAVHVHEGIFFSSGRIAFHLME